MDSTFTADIYAHYFSGFHVHYCTALLSKFEKRDKLKIVVVIILILTHVGWKHDALNYVYIETSEITLPINLID